MNAACRTCGQLNPPGATTCQFCGASLPSTPIYRGLPRTRPQPQIVIGPMPAVTKEPTAGLLLELIPGLFVFLGIGYIWSGEVALGIVLLLGYWILGVLLAAFTLLSFGLLLICFPLFLLYWPGVPIISALILHGRMTRRQRQLISAMGYPQPY